MCVTAFHIIRLYLSKSREYILIFTEKLVECTYELAFKKLFKVDGRDMEN